MLIARQTQLLRSACLACQWRSFSTFYRHLAERPSQKPVQEDIAIPYAAPPKAAANSPLADAPRSYGKRHENFTPRPLPRPIGLAKPPRPGENSGIDLRTLRERRDDFVNFDKHLERREYLKSKMARPYFRDWGNMTWHKGKTFVAPPRLFKRELALYFPNLYGKTLLKSDTLPRDTTPILQGRVSVVSLFSSTWAENQANTFVSPEHNPALQPLLNQATLPAADPNDPNEATPDRAQLVRINVEEDALKAFLIRLFVPGLRKRLGEASWDKYFVVRRGLSDEIRESIGVLNGKVGYTYLLDSECRIRWAASGIGEDHERLGLAKGVQRLLEEEKALQKSG